MTLNMYTLTSPGKGNYPPSTGDKLYDDPTNTKRKKKPKRRKPKPNNKQNKKINKTLFTGLSMEKKFKNIVVTQFNGQNSGC